MSGGRKQPKGEVQNMATKNNKSGGKGKKPAASAKPAGTRPAGAPQKRKSAYTPIGQLSPKEQQERRNRFKTLRLGSPKAAHKAVSYARERLSRPDWKKLGVDPTPIYTALDDTIERLKNRVAQSGQAWPLPKEGDKVSVREKHLALYMDDEEITAEHLQNMTVRRVTQNEDGKNKRVKCALTVGDETLVITCKPRHLQPAGAVQNEDDEEDDDDEEDEEDDDSDE